MPTISFGFILADCSVFRGALDLVDDRLRAVSGRGPLLGGRDDFTAVEIDNRRQQFCTPKVDTQRVPLVINPFLGRAVMMRDLDLAGLLTRISTQDFGQRLSTAGGQPRSPSGPDQTPRSPRP